MHKILNIIVNNGTNERLDSIALSDNHYLSANKQSAMALDALCNTLSDGQMQLLDTYISKYNATSAIYTQSAYKLGLKDMLSLLQDLK